MRLAVAFVAGCAAGALILVVSLTIADELDYRRARKEVERLGYDPMDGCA